MCDPQIVVCWEAQMTGSVGIAALKQGAGVANNCCIAGTRRGGLNIKWPRKCGPGVSVGARLSANFATSRGRMEAGRIRGASVRARKPRHAGVEVHSSGGGFRSRGRCVVGGTVVVSLESNAAFAA